MSLSPYRSLHPDSPCNVTSCLNFPLPCLPGHDDLLPQTVSTFPFYMHSCLCLSLCCFIDMSGYVHACVCIGIHRLMSVPVHAHAGQGTTLGGILINTVYFFFF